MSTMDVFPDPLHLLRVSLQHRSPTCNAIKDFNAPIQILVRGSIADAEMTVAPTEDIAGNNKQVVADRFFHEMGTSSPRCLGKDIKRSARFNQFEPFR